MLAVYDSVLFTINSTNKFYFQIRLILNVKRQTTLKIHLKDFNMILHNQTFMKLNLTKWTKKSSYMF